MEPVDENDELTVRARQRIGERLIDKWLLDGLLGVGGMAAVYSATHRNGKRVAIKVLHRDGASSDETRARFLREGFVANAVGHKGAVSVLDEDITEDGSPFFVMDLFDGETLDSRLRRKGALDADEVLSATYYLLDVLVSAHEKGIIHRDIKPENVFLTKDAQVKVLDFGIAQLRQRSAATTQVGHTMGTPSFMSPEQARGRWDEVDARSDVWSVGATMFTLLTARHVHEADTLNEVLLGAMATHAKPISLYRPDLPREVCEVVDRALAFDKSDRWESARAMQSAIGACYSALKRTSEDWVRAPTLMATSVRTPHVVQPTATPRTATTARPIARTASVKDAPISEGELAAVPPRRRERAGLVILAATLTLALGSWAVVNRGEAVTPRMPSIAAQPQLPPVPSMPAPSAPAGVPSGGAIITSSPVDVPAAAASSEQNAGASASANDETSSAPAAAPGKIHVRRPAPAPPAPPPASAQATASAVPALVVAAPPPPAANLLDRRH